MNLGHLKNGRAGLCGLPALLLLAGCGATGEDQPVGGATANEAQALNDAASMLDVNVVVPDNAGNAQ